MPSPFPGMDPYLEGHLWPDMHNGLAFVIKEQLVPYRAKRQRLYESGVHLLEIDLIRRGERPFRYPNAPKAHYWATLVRAGSGRTDIWAFNIQNPLPLVPVPL